MLKRKIDTYLTNYYATNRNALLITGARQIGKTYSIREFGRTFKSFIEINFLENPDAVALLFLTTIILMSEENIFMPQSIW
ncbi:AAA family ATPase [uncultured Bacteroides sp.]|uniref:AAA family ATPase n=1 Tax=uncultured Bacteroides sp. TaxID=162156 RepID=UPI0025DE7BE6|nr:AAA family ATPase [uncultured Bacteroides sp.]